MKGFFTTERFLVFIFLLLATGALFGPILIGRTLMPLHSDLVSQYYPAFIFYSEALHASTSFLWMPHIFSGFPVYLSQMGGFFDPLNLLIFSFFGGIAGVELRLVFDVLLTFVCAYGAARVLGLSRSVSALVGPSYLLSYHWLYLSNPLNANTLFLLPLLIVCAVRALDAERGGWKYIILAGVGLGWALLCGYTQLVVYAVLLAGIFAAGYLLFVQGERNLKRLATAAGGGILVLSIASLIGLPQILPAAQFLPLSSRAEVVSYAQLTEKIIAPGDMVTTFVPPYFYMPYVDQGRKPLYVGALLGALAWITILVSVWSLFVARGWSPLSMPQRRATLVAVVFLFAFIAAFKWSPLYLLLSQLPVLGYFRFPFRFMFLGAFLLALMGGFGLEYAKELVRTKLFKAAVYTYAAVTAALVALFALPQLLGSAGSVWLSTVLFAVFSKTLNGHFGFQKDLAHYKDAFENGLAAYRELLAFSEPHILFPVLALIGSSVVAVLFVREKITAENFRRIALGVSGATILMVGVVQWGVYGRADALTAPSVMEGFLTKEDRALYRVYSFMPGAAAAPFIPPQYKLSPEEERVQSDLAVAGAQVNYHVFTGLRSIDGYDQFEPKLTLDALGAVGGELAAGYGSGTLEERALRLEKNTAVLGIMGVKHVISGIPLVSSDLQLLAVPTSTSYAIPLYVYEYARPTPHYYLAVRPIAAPGKSITEISGSFAAGDVYLDCATCGGGAGRAGTLSLEARSNGWYRFSATTTREQYLVLSETFVPGWHARLDEKPIALVRANGLYMSVLVPAGAHSIDFEYRGMLQEASWLKALGIFRQ